MGAMFRLRQNHKSETPADAAWAGLIPHEQWAVYLDVLHRAKDRGIQHAVGGGFAFSHYSRRWRNTKDIDLYIKPADRDAMIEVLHAAGLVDYFEVLPYDRNWIYRSYKKITAPGRPDEIIIVDIIWQMANYRAQVDDDWLTRGDLVRIHGWPLRMLPAEELIWAKLYIVQRDRCDWGDLLNILYARGPQLEWRRFIDRLGEDWRVLAALVQLFTWACPQRALELPKSVWKALAITPPSPDDMPAAIGPVPGADARHIRLLDSRDWFGPTPPPASAGEPPPAPGP